MYYRVLDIPDSPKGHPTMKNVKPGDMIWRDPKLEVAEYNGEEYIWVSGGRQESSDDSLFRNFVYLCALAPCDYLEFWEKL